MPDPDKTCGNCKFSTYLGGDLVCRRYPPVPLYSAPGLATNGRLAWVYPRIRYSAWCGEHED